MSLIKPGDHRQVDRRLISPALGSLFAFWPRIIRKHIDEYISDIGLDFVSIIFFFMFLSSRTKTYSNAEIFLLVFSLDIIFINLLFLVFFVGNILYVLSNAIIMSNIPKLNV